MTNTLLVEKTDNILEVSIGTFIYCKELNKGL